MEKINTNYKPLTCTVWAKKEDEQLLFDADDLCLCLIINLIILSSDVFLYELSRLRSIVGWLQFLWCFKLSWHKLQKIYCCQELTNQDLDPSVSI